MNMTDPIADMLTRIRNAMMARHEVVGIPASRIKVKIAEILKDEGYIRNFRVEERIPQIHGNYQRIEQVVVNLLQNACDSLPDNSRSIAIKTNYNEHSGSVVISIADNGVGIPADLLSRIKEPFFTTKRETGGMGLGLSVSSAIVSEHQGSLDFESATGKGTTATVILPVTQQGEMG